MRKLKATLGALVVAMALTSATATDIRDCFSKAPEMMFPTLTVNTRLDMIDYYDYGSTVASKNRFEAPCRVTSISADSTAMNISIGNVTEVTLQLLPYGKKEIVMMIYDVKTPTVDSQVSFYSTAWQQLDADKLLGDTSLQAWLASKVDRATMADIENAVPFVMYKATYDASSKQLTLTNEFADYLPALELAKVQAYLRDKLVYRWNGSKFQQIKK